MPASETQTSRANPAKIIREPEFAARLSSACDGNPDIPEYNKGRLTWVATQMTSVLHEKVTVETVRRWFAGVMKPKARKLSKLAELLQVDESWLSLGIDAGMAPREMRARNATADGAVNVLAGFIQMDGGIPAFPAQTDQRAQDSRIDLYAIIKGAQYGFHVALAHDEGDSYRFMVPTTYADAFIIGVVPTPGPGVEFYEIPAAWIEEHGVRRGGHLEAVVAKSGDKLVRRITTFEDRL